MREFNGKLKKEQRRGSTDSGHPQYEVTFNGVKKLINHPTMSAFVPSISQALNGMIEDEWEIMEFKQWIQ